MVDDSVEVARIIEAHEALVWSTCVEATAAVPGNPLKAEVDRSGNTPLCTLAALNFASFNRVIAFGVVTPATDEDIEVVRDFYSSRSGTRYVIEVTPASRPESLVPSLVRHGFRPTGEGLAKCWRTIRDIPPEPSNVEVRELSGDHRDQYVAVNLAAWGLPGFFSPWFGATFGLPGFRYYGVFDGDVLTSSVAMHVCEDVAWTGFGATRPAYQGRGYQSARIIRMMHDAAEMGCHTMHNEAGTGTPGSPSPSLHNLLKTGFTRIYDKEAFSPPSG